MEDEINIFDYIKVIKKHKKLILLIFIIVEIITLIFTITTPKKYESTVTILPPEALKEKSSLVVSRLPYLEEIPSPLSSYVGGAGTQVLIALLKSRSMKEDIIENFDLINFYKKSKTAIIKKLERGTTIKEIRDQGIISVKVESENPNLAAKIANFYAENLDNMNSRLNISSVKPIATILDSAVVPQKPCNPKVKLSLAVAGIFSLFIGILLSFFINYLKESKKSS